MLEQLRFVQGSVAKKDFIPELKHFRIEDGRVKGFNGKIALSTPIEFDIDCTPKAEPLIKAISQCKEAVQLGMTKAGRLSVKSGKFRAYVECVEGVTPHVEPEGAYIDVDGAAVMQALKVLEPLVATDAARPWSNGVLFKGKSAFATNNVIVAEYWIGAAFPNEVIIPREAIKEMLRIKKEPTGFQMNENSLSVHYDDGSWVRANLVDHKWPEVAPLFDVPMDKLKHVPDEFFEALHAMKPFADKFGRITFEPGNMRTHQPDVEDGSSYALEWLQDKGSFQLGMLLKLEGLATKMDLSQYPERCPWVGENMRGVLLGLHWLEGVL